MTEQSHYDGVKGVLTTLKGAHGEPRWILVSSNAYRDRDGEIVSLQALENDVARSNKTGQCGPLRWWHVPGLDIGTCDFRAMHGRFLIESGTFLNDAIAQAVAREAPNLQVSLGFFHPLSEPTQDGVYTTIRSFERSLVPFGKAANPYTQLMVTEGQNMNEQKKAALTSLLGDEQLLESLLHSVDGQNDALIANGVATKCVAMGKKADGSPMRYRISATPIEEDEVETEEEMIPLAEVKGKKTKVKAEDMSSEGSEPQFVADLTVDEFRNLLDEIFMDNMAAMQKPEAPAPKETPVMKKKDDEFASELEELRAMVTAIRQENETLRTTVKELQGDIPTGYRASVAPETVAQKQVHQAPESYISIVDKFFGLSS